MATKTTPQITATRALRRCCAVGSGVSEPLVEDMGAQPYQGYDEDQHHEGREAERDGDVAAPARTGGGLALAGGIAHGCSGAQPARCSTSRVANRSVR